MRGHPLPALAWRATRVLLCFTVSGAAQMPGDSGGASDHSGPRPRRCQQPLSHWTGKARRVAGLQAGLSVCEVGKVWGRNACGKACELAWWACRPSLPSLQISSVLRARRPDTYLQRFLSLQQSFLCCAFAIVLGGGCFLQVALHLEKDQAQAQQPGSGTSTPHTHARPRAEPHRNKEHQPPPELLASLFVHSFTIH